MANELAYGFVGLQHLADERVQTVGQSVVWNAVAESVQEHQRQVDGLLASFVTPTTDYSKRYYLPIGGTLQPLDEWGNPIPFKAEGFYDVAFPIQGGGTAWGDNRVSRALMTVQEANRFTLSVLRQDADWLKRHIMAAMFTNVTWTYPDAEQGNLTIQPLANGDTVTYNLIGGSKATDTHFLAQANAISDSDNPFDNIYDELMEHPGNAGGVVVVYVPTNLKAAITGLTAFEEVKDADLIPGISSDRLGAVIDRGLGDEVLGKANKCWIVEWRSLPDSYMLAHARGAAGTPLAMRQYPAAELQGLFAEGFSPDGNLQERRFIRYAGFGALDRVSALAYRVGNASYAIPSGYTAPLSI